MPVSVVCDAASVNAALRDSIASSSGAGCSGNQNDDTQSIQSKLVASAKRVLLSKIEYEEVNNYSQSVLDTLKSKYIVLKPSSSASAKSNNGDKDANQSTSSTLNNTMAISGQQNGSRDPNQLPQPKRILFPRENVQIGWKSSNRKWQVGAGMMNVGNTCYLNSTLQAIFHVPAMANWLMSDAAHREKCEEENGSQGGCIICAMSKTLIASQTSQSAIRPYLVYSKLRLVCKHLIMGRQEDAHEFLRYLVEAMEKSYLARFRNSKDLEQFSKETTPLNQILGGYLKSAVRCLACGHVSTTYQHFQDLLLDIRKANTIEEALDGYFARERLEDMGYKCEDCKKKVSATKQFTLERAPISLCIQLKRFSMMGTKLNKHVGIRPRLDLTPYASKKNGEKLTYRLVAMVTHLGASQHCGHYTAIGLTDAGGYYQFDDSSVRPISIQNVLNTNAYIIFYELEDPNSQARLGGLGQGLSSTHNEQQSRMNGQMQHNDNNSSQQRQNSNLSTNNCNSTVSINTKVINKLDMGSPSTLIGPQLPERSILKTNQNNIDNNYNNKNNDVQKPLQNGLATNNSYSKLVNSPNKTFKSNNDSNHDAPSTSTSNSLQSASQKANNITLGNKLVIHFKNNTSSSTSSGFNNGNKFQDSNGTKHQAPNTNKAQTNGYDSSSSVVRCKSTLPSMPKLESSSIVKEKSPSTQNGQITLPTASPSKLYVNGHTKNDKVSPVKSLVPYESDDDSNDSNFITTKSDSNKHEPNNGIKAESTTVKRSYDISDDSGSDTEAPPRKTKSNPPSPPVVKTKVGLWQVTNADIKPTLNSSPSERKNPFATATTTISGGNFYANSSSKLSGKDKRFNNANNSNRKTDLTGNGETKETVNHLLKYSHRGYGAPVLSWNGHKTDMEKEVIEESRLERKREIQNEEENEMDRGRQKKIKTHQTTTRDNPGYNPFQEYQNQNRRWNNNNNTNNGHTQNGRPSFHQNYTPYRHHPFHRNQNNFRRHRFHQRPHHQRNGDHGFHHRRES